MRIIKILLIFISSLLLLVGCSSNEENPKERVGKFLELYVDGNIEEMRRFSLNQDSQFIALEYKQYFGDVIINSDSFDFFLDFYENDLIPVIASKIKYNIKKENIENDTAIVSVSLETPNMSAIIQKLMINDQILSINESELNNLFLAEISSNKLTKTELQFHLQLIDDIWLIDLERFEVMDVLSGGLLSEYQNIYQSALDEIKQRIGEDDSNEN